MQAARNVEEQKKDCNVKYDPFPDPKSSLSLFSISVI